MTALQPREHLVGFTQTALSFLTKDLKALAEDKNNTCPGGCARTALDLVTECARINRRVGSFLSTGAPPPDMSDEEKQALLASLDTADKALAFLNGETQYLLSVLKDVDESTLGDMTTGFMPIPMSRFGIAELPAMHMMYHDGQINYIQSLHGDDKMHWFD